MCCIVFSLCTYLEADDTYIQLKKDLEYLDLKVSCYGSLLPFCVIFVLADFSNHHLFRNGDALSSGITVGFRTFCVFVAVTTVKMQP